jgi:hypothetical protein
MDRRTVNGCSSQTEKNMTATGQQFNAIMQPKIAGVRLDAALASLAQANIAAREAGIAFDYDAVTAPIREARAVAAEQLRAAWGTVEHLSDDDHAALHDRVCAAIDAYVGASK